MGHRSGASQRFPSTTPCFRSSERVLWAPPEMATRQHRGTHTWRKRRWYGVCQITISALLCSPLPRSTRSISSSPRPGWIPACATTAAVPGCQLSLSTGDVCGCRGCLAVKSKAPQATAILGIVLGLGLADKTWVFPPLRRSPASSHWEYLIGGQNSSLSREEARN